MSKITIIAKLTIQDGKDAEMEAALATLCSVADEETGLEIYSAHKDTAEDNVYWFFEMYTGDEAWAAHGKGDGMKEAMGAFGGLLAGRPELHILSPVAAKGLDI